MKTILINTLRQKADELEVNTSKINEKGCLKILRMLDLLENGDTVMSRREAYDYLGVSKSSFDILINNKLIPNGQKLHDGSKSLFWYKSDLDDYLENQHS